MSEIQCKVCSSKRTKLLKHGDSEYIYCENCSLYFIKDYQTEDNYSLNFEQDFVVGPQQYLKSENRRISRIVKQLELISEISRYKPKPAALLDIGCGQGYFLDEARRHGYNTAGVELSRYAVYCCKSIGLRIYNRITEIDEKFDIAVLHNTLVKTPNPLKTMNNIFKLLNDNGFVFIRVPYSNEKFWKIFEIPTERFLKQYYHQYFNEKSLKKLMELSGFEIVKVEIKKPVVRYERKIFRLINAVFSKYFNLNNGISNRFKRWYSDLFKKELVVIARKK